MPDTPTRQPSAAAPHDADSAAPQASAAAPTVDICLATYNGERYLPQQLDSLFAQTYQDFRILVRDDGSTDDTPRLIDEYAGRHPGRIVVIRDSVRCGSAVRNFMQIMEHATAPYVMFCDQDDVWNPGKVERTLDFMRSEERTVGADRPVLVFCDYEVVDADLEPLDVPDANLQVAAAHCELNRLLVQNYVTGCTMMVNHAACALAEPYDERIPMHDWWLALCCAAMGRVAHLPEKLMEYRQHGTNEVGAVDVKSWSYRLAKFRDPAARKSAQSYFELAGLLDERYGERMPGASRATLRRFLDIPGHAKLRRMADVVRGGFFKSDLVRTIGFIAWI
ncbi:MAG: glycosyltransferase family 2 protein [Bifidobacteriaceae bacterium]|nr:glycosyltransferase family 2 protein [Bifidobacteriaceae bacterium]